MPNIVPHKNQDETEQERNPPTPLQKLFPRRNHGHHRQYPRRHEQTNRHPNLRKRPKQPPPILRRMLNRHEHSPTPLAAGRNPLDNPQKDKQQRRYNTRGGVGGQHTDQGGGDPHAKQGNHEDLAPTYPVTEMPGQKGAERPKQERQAHREKG